MGTFVATAFYYTVISSSVPLVFLILITALLCLVGQLGDLVFSSISDDGIDSNITFFFYL